MRKGKISYRDIELKRIISVEDHEKTLNSIENLLVKNERMDFVELLRMKLEIQNLIIDTQAKLSKNSNINAPALLFFLGSYISGLIGIFLNEVQGWIIGTGVALVLMIIYVSVTNRLVAKYSKELLVYENVEKLLDYIYFKHKKN